MRIPGLPEFVKAKASRYEIYSRREIRGDLVIDGSQLCHHYYQLDRVNGGQYPEFRRKVSAFFSKLQQCGIRSHVVFEGVDKNDKLTEDYILKKKKNRHEKSVLLLEERPDYCPDVSELPQLAYTVLMNVFVEMGIPMYVGDGEGDDSCVQIANFLRCPVLCTHISYLLFS